MTDIVGLLENKNNCLQLFFNLNEAEIVNFDGGNFDNLDNFYQGRESILNMIQRIDKKIEDSNSNFLNYEEITNANRKSVLECLTLKNELVAKILAQDLHILSVIEATKSMIIKELCSVKSARKAMRGYRSGISDTHLDEKI